MAKQRYEVVSWNNSKTTEASYLSMYHANSSNYEYLQKTNVNININQ